MECAHAARADFGLTLRGAGSAAGSAAVEFVFLKPDEILHLT